MGDIFDPGPWLPGPMTCVSKETLSPILHILVGNLHIDYY